MTYSCVLCLRHMLQKGAGRYYALKGWGEKRRDLFAKYQGGERTHKSGDGVTQAPCRVEERKDCLCIRLLLTCFSLLFLFSGPEKQRSRGEGLYPGHPGCLRPPPSVPLPQPRCLGSSAPSRPHSSLGCVPPALMSLYQSPELFLARCSRPEGLLKASRNYYRGRCQGAIDLATCDSLGKEG